MQVCKGRSWFFCLLPWQSVSYAPFFHSKWPCLVLNYMVTSIISHLYTLDLCIFNKIVLFSLHFSRIPVKFLDPLIIFSKHVIILFHDQLSFALDYVFLCQFCFMVLFCGLVHFYNFKRPVGFSSFFSAQSCCVFK